MKWFPTIQKEGRENVVMFLSYLCNEQMIDLKIEFYFWLTITSESALTEVQTGEGV